MALLYQRRQNKSAFSFYTSAVNVTLPAFAAGRRGAAAPLLLGGGRAAIDRYSCPPGPQQQTRNTLPQRATGTERRMDGRRTVT